MLSLVDEHGRPADGFLQTRDIYKLRLSADLVVLSACQTALGKEVRGEGLLGLSRGFMYAGAPRIVASLWQVPDRATSELMKHFYRGILVEGLRPADALRAAQTAIRGEKRWSSPTTGPPSSSRATGTDVSTPEETRADPVESADDLVGRIRQGDRQAEDELVQRYRRGVAIILRAESSDAAAVDDLFQETFRIALEKIRQGTSASRRSSPGSSARWRETWSSTTSEGSRRGGPRALSSWRSSPARARTRSRTSSAPRGARS